MVFHFSKGIGCRWASNAHKMEDGGWLDSSLRDEWQLRQKVGTWIPCGSRSTGIVRQAGDQTPIGHVRLH